MSVPNRNTRTNTKSKKNGGQQQQKARRELILWPNGQIGRPNRVNKSSGEKIASHAVAYQRNQSNMRRPDQRMTQDGCIVTYKEYVQDIVESTAFTSSAFPIQPGIPTLFPWLSTSAILYQEYSIEALEFHYDTEVGSNTAGKVMLSISPDAADAVPATKQEALNYNCKESTAVWSPCILRVPKSEFNTLGKRRYIRNGVLSGVGTNLDIKTYDVGQLFVSRVGMAGTTALVGELYVQYTIRFHNPIQNLRQLVSGFSKVITADPAAVTDASMWAGTPTLSSGLDATVTGNTITFNRVGTFFLEYVVVGTGLFTAYVPVTTGSTVTSITQLSGISDAAANAGLNAICSYTISVLSRGLTFQCNHNTQATTITAATCRIAGFSSSLV